MAFLAFELKDIGDEFRTDVALMDMKHHRLFSSHVRMIYLQLPLFTKREEECATNFDKWIYALKNMEQLITTLPWAGQDSVFAQLANIADISSLTKEDRMRYDASIRKYRDTINVMEGAREEGMAKGLERGRAEGMAKGRAEGERLKALQIAERLKHAGMHTADIANATGLTTEEIDSL